MPTCDGAPGLKPPMTLAMLRGVSKRYGQTVVLHSVDLDVLQGEKVVICGPSGSGKSTLISCINGLVRHDGGRIEVAGIEVSHALGTLEQVRQQVGMVFQQFNLFAHLSVLDNCTLGPRLLLGLTRSEAEGRALDELSRLCAFYKVLGSYPVGAL